MRTIRRTGTFKRDYKRVKKGRRGNTLDTELSKVLAMLVADEPLPERCHDHSLVGEWKDHRDCHIRPDLVLIYRKSEAENLDLVRLGSHSELGI